MLIRYQTQADTTHMFTLMLGVFPYAICMHLFIYNSLLKRNFIIHIHLTINSEFCHIASHWTFGWRVAGANKRFLVYLLLFHMMFTIKRIYILSGMGWQSKTKAPHLKIGLAGIEVVSFSCMVDACRWLYANMVNDTSKSIYHGLTIIQFEIVFFRYSSAGCCCQWR